MLFVCRWIFYFCFNIFFIFYNLITNHKFSPFFSPNLWMSVMNSTLLKISEVGVCQLNELYCSYLHVLNPICIFMSQENVPLVTFCVILFSVSRHDNKYAVQAIVVYWLFLCTVYKLYSVIFLLFCVWSWLFIFYRWQRLKRTRLLLII